MGVAAAQGEASKAAKGHVDGWVPTLDKAEEDAMIEAWKAGSWNDDGGPDAVDW